MLFQPPSELMCTTPGLTTRHCMWYTARGCTNTDDDLVNANKQLHLHPNNHAVALSLLVAFTHVQLATFTSDALLVYYTEVLSCTYHICPASLTHSKSTNIEWMQTAVVMTVMCC